MVKRMSDPMTNTDVEDVLASIRRLVSDNARPGSASVQQPPSDRLVLTPSLRVPEEDDADVSAFEDEDFADDVQDDEDEGLSAFAENAFRKDELAPDRLNVRENGFEPADDSAVVAQLSADLPVRGAFRSARTSEEAKPSDPMVLSNDMDEQVDDVSSDMEESSELAGDTEALIVPEDWACEVDEPAAADTADEDAPEGEQAEPVTAETSHEVDVPEPDVFDQGDLAGEPAETAAQSLSEKIAALETLVGKRPDQFEPDDPGTDAYAGTEEPAMEWEDVEPEVSLAEQPEETGHDELEAQAGPMAQDDLADAVSTDSVAENAQVEPELSETVHAEVQHEDESDGGPDMEVSASQNTSVEAGTGGLFGSDDDLLDEDALRELISDIVREELQGALGERITRNVRKLVRREIHRALAAQDLE